MIWIIAAISAFAVLGWYLAICWAIAGFKMKKMLDVMFDRADEQ